jgi:hypothetical protein
MGTLNAYGQLTLLELAKRTDPKGEAAKIAEIMSEANEILLDAQWGEANNITSHKVVRRDYLPAGTWRHINKGVTKEASITTQVNEPIGFLESYSEVDKALVDMAPNPKQFRMDEAGAFIEGMSQSLAAAIMYAEHAVDPEKLDGLSNRLNALSMDRVISAGGSGGDTTSVFAIQWGLNQVFMAYPRGSKTIGIEHKDLGEVTLDDGASGLYQGFRDHFVSRSGLVVKDTRCIARVANIESTGAANLFNEDDLITVLNQMKNGGKGAIIYVNRTIKTQMEIALIDRANINFTVADGLGGVPVLFFRGSPVRLVDQIANNEATVA